MMQQFSNYLIYNGLQLITQGARQMLELSNRKYFPKTGEIFSYSILKTFEIFMKKKTWWMNFVPDFKIEEG
jgi:hypothetical protein